MWTSDDVLRSVRRSIGLVLPAGKDGWTHRVEEREIPVEARPMTVTLLGNEGVTRARETLDQGEIVTQWSLTIYAYPAVGEDARAARRAGDAIRDQLHDIIRFGFARVPELSDEDGRHKSGPYRLPLWDYAGVEMGAPADEQPDLPHDVIWVERASVTAQNLKDPEDERRRSIVVECRVTIESPGRTDQTGPTVGSMPGRFGEWPEVEPEP